MVPDQQQHRLHSKLGFMIITEKRKPLMYTFCLTWAIWHQVKSQQMHRHTKCCMRRETHQLLLQLIKAKQHLILWESCKCGVIKLHRHRHLPPSLNPSSRPSSSFSLHHVPSSFLADTSLCFFAQDGDVFRRRRGWGGSATAEIKRGHLRSGERCEWHTRRGSWGP